MSNGFLDFLDDVVGININDLDSGLFGSLENLGDSSAVRGLGGLALLAKAYSDLGGVGTQGLGLGQQLAEEQMQQAAFRPYTVTSATGGRFMAGPEGQYTLTMSPEEQAFQQQMFGGAGDFFRQAAVDPSVREEQILGQIEDALAPEQRAQRLGLEERLAAQGLSLIHI